MSSDLTGRVVGGYRIDSELGRGGQAVVYRATQLSLQRTVALKVVTGQLSADTSFLERFTREGIAAASLDHPHIIPVFEAGEADGVAYLAMKYIDGPSFDGLLRQQGGIEARRSLAILHQVAEALDYVAERDMVHRDVKPANVLLGPGDHAYLSDFGLIKAMTGSRLTGTGVWMGTLEYVAPEQIRGADVGPAADRYALAALAFEALTGTSVFARDDRAATLYAHISEPPPPASERLPALGTGVDPVLARGLAKAPEDRYPSALAFVQALEGAINAHPGAAAARPGRDGATPAGPTISTGAPATQAPPPVSDPPPAATAPPATTPPPSDPPASDPPASDPPRSPSQPPPPQYLSTPSEEERRAAAGGPGGRPRWLIPAIAGGIAAAVLVIVLVVALSGGGGGGNTVTTYVVDTTTQGGTTTSTPGGQFPIGAVLPSAIDGWQLAGTDPAVAGLELSGRGEVETAQATNGSSTALLIGMRSDGEDGRVAVERLRSEIGGTRDGSVPLTGMATEGVVQVSGGGTIVSFGDTTRAIVVIAPDRDTAAAVATATSAALGGP